MDDATKLRKAEELLGILKAQDDAHEARRRAVAAAQALEEHDGLDAHLRVAAELAAASQRCQALAALIESRRGELGIGPPLDEDTFAGRQEDLGAAIQTLERAVTSQRLQHG